MKVETSKVPPQFTGATSKKCVSAELCSTMCVVMDALERDYRP